MSKEIKNAFWDFGSLIMFQGMAMPLSIAYSAVVARNLGPEEFGTWALLFAFVRFVFVICVNWTGAAVLKFGKERLFKHGNMAEVFWARNLILMSLLSIALGTLFFFSEAFVQFYKVPFRVLYLLVLLISLYSLYDYSAWILKTTNRVKQCSWTFLLRQVVLFGGISIALAGGYSVGISFIITLEILAYLVVILLALLYIDKSVYLPVRVDLSVVKEICLYSWPLIFSFSSGFVIDWIDLYVIKLFFTVRETGVYQAAYKLYFFLTNILSALTTVLFPIIMAVSLKEKENLVKGFFIQRLVPQLTGLWAIFISFLVLFSDILVNLIFGENYSGASLPFQIILLGAGAQIIAFSYSSVLTTFSTLKKLAAVHIATALINLVLDLILVKIFGIKGAAIATAIAVILSTLSYLFIVHGKYGIRNNRALFFILLPTAALINNMIFTGLGAKFLALIGIIAGGLWMVKRLGICSKEDITLVEKIQMPPQIQKGIGKIYRRLSV